MIDSVGSVASRGPSTGMECQNCSDCSTLSISQTPPRHMAIVGQAAADRQTCCTRSGIPGQIVAGEHVQDPSVASEAASRKFKSLTVQSSTRRLTGWAPHPSRLALLQ